LGKNEESSKYDDIKKEIDKDYKQFNDSKKDYNVTLDIDSRKYLFAIIALLIILSLVMTLTHYLVRYIFWREEQIQRFQEVAQQNQADLRNFADMFNFLILAVS
jgi:hypothetical protein